jgi:sulfur carrier protein ThiS
VKSAQIAQGVSKRQANGVDTLEVETIDDQQRIADLLYSFGFLPKRVAVPSAAQGRKT